MNLIDAIASEKSGNVSGTILRLSILYVPYCDHVKLDKRHVSNLVFRALQCPGLP